MKRLLLCLCCCIAVLTAIAADHDIDCAVRSYQFIKKAEGVTKINDEQLAALFIQYAGKADERYHMFVYDDGSVLVGDKLMDRKQAAAFVEGIRSDGMVVLLIGGSYSRKAERTIQTLGKSVKALVKQRSKSGIDYDTYPVLTTTRSDYTQIMKRAKETAMLPPPPEMPSVAIDTIVTIEEAEPETMVKPKPQAGARSKAKYSSASETSVAPTQGERAIGNYEVHVATTLSVRSKPSASATKLGSLQNGEQVSVRDFIDGWACITYKGKQAYIKADYIVPCTERASVAPVNNDYSYAIWQWILHITPALIVLFLVLTCVCSDTLTMIFLAATGLMELLYSAADQRASISGLAWFCSPHQVGWIMTIIDFVILLVVLIAQHGIFKGMVINMLTNGGRRGCSLVILFLLSYPLFAIVGITLEAALVNPIYFWVPFLAMAVLCLLIKWVSDAEWSVALVIGLWAAVSFGGLFAFFLSTAGVLILGGIIYVLISAAANGSSSVTQTASSSSVSSNQSANATQGELERDAFGGAHVRHPDGSVTDLPGDFGNGEFRDTAGHTWHKGPGGGNGMYRW